MILSLPWENIGSPEVAREVKKSVFSLGYDSDLMSREADELDYEFRFDWKVYGYQAVMMIKIDQNLKNLRERITPDLVSEEDFWRNYFFEVEKILQDNNQPSRLRGRIDRAERERKRLEAEALLHSQPNQLLPN
jgi:hypothetical protein